LKIDHGYKSYKICHFGGHPVFITLIRLLHAVNPNILAMHVAHQASDRQIAQQEIIFGSPCISGLFI